ncbi:DNA (cytosine-5-)-methyltransferase [Gemmatimonas sp.]|uniref:DNA (cytosine-5-)-methyltransferase n=1 Tax=Gemmatimonas sp. TaxID=1962908 RepID=UPI0025BD2E9B|nr:DNA (cytosine-5-)-methyltransferase [Gemmatimonas sp.]MCA2992531.1 DNA (cytosine-5-)-methyltransferase [Gemmatimonas sp.]
MSPTKEKPAVQAIKHALRYWTQEELAARIGRQARTVRRWVVGETSPPWEIATLIERELTRDQRPTQPDFTFIDLFAGIGGIRRGFEELNGRCVFTSEWDTHAQRTYKANYPDADDIFGDITKADVEKHIPAHDLLLAGFPCQPFSLAGVSKKNSLGRAHGFLDRTQGTLFFDIVKILKHHQPRAFLLENVKNLRSHDGGKTFEIIMGSLQELGYTVTAKLIDATPWVPQRRERVYLVGFRDPVSVDFEGLMRPKVSPTLESILHRTDEEPEERFTYRVGKKTLVNPRYTLSDHLWKYLQDYAAKHRAKGNGFGCSVFGPDDVARTLSARYHKDGSEILIDQGRKANPRRLTPRECARLMGFDSEGSAPMAIPVSDTQAYRQFGNSVAVPVVRVIAKMMVPRLLRPADFPLADSVEAQPELFAETVAA